MKKIISFILVAMLCIGVLTGCEQVGGAWDSVTGAVGGAWDTVVGTVGGWLGIEQPAKGPSIEDASSYLNDIYKDKNEITTGDFDVVGKIILDGVSFNVTWTSDNEAITIRESTKVGFYTVDLPDKNDVEFGYTLTATVTNEAGESAQRSFSFKVPVINNSGITSTPIEGVAYKLFLLQGTYGQRFYALNTTQDNGNKFINTTVDPKAGVDFYVEAVDGGYKIYTDIKGVKTYVYAKVEVSVNEETGAKKYSKFIGFNAEEGSVFSYSEAKGGVWTVNVDGLVYGVGTYGDYTTISLSDESYFTPEKVGDSQFVMQFITSEYANTLAPDEVEKVEVPEPNSTLTVKEAIDLGLAVIGYTEGKYYVTGEITNIYQTTYGNMYIKDAEGNELCIYGTYDATGKNRFDAMENQPKVGDTVTIYGVVGNYNGTAQIKNGWITAINGENLGGGETPSAPTVVDAPVVGTAYKFGMVQGKLNKTFYLAGGMNGYYMATTEDASAAIDVYLEETQGGYYLYTLNGESKLYLNMVVATGDDGKTHVNAKYENAPSTVYTYDAESKTVVSSLVVDDKEAENYWWGTRNDKEYTTVGPCAVSYEGFYCQFYAVTEGGETPDNPGTKPDVPVTGGVQLTVDSMGLPSQSYNAESSTATVNGVEFEFIQLGNYGDGIQMRDKDGKTSMLWNTTAFATPIVRIELVFSSTKSTHDNTDAVIFTFGNEVKGATYTTKLSTAAGTATYTITPDAETYTYFYLEHDLSYSFYWESITIVLAEEDTHEHSYNSVVTAPTCTAAGYTTYTCECGDSYTADETEATGHTEVVDAAVEAKCEATGLTEGKHCSVCNEVLVAQQETEALGHAMIVDEAKAPTCTETGLTAGEHCDRCDYKVAQETEPANGHTDAEPKDFICDVCNADLCTNHTEEILPAQEATCTSTGLTEGKKCSICGDILVAQEVVNALGHNETSVVTAPTCTEPGYTTYTCSVCGASRTADETEATGHSYNEVVTDPTCTEPGYTTYTCSVCGDSYTDNETAVIDHNYVDGICSACGAEDPDYYFVVSISDALAADDGKKVQVSGTVCAINTAWSDSYGNISVTIVDENGYELYLYRLKTNVTLGDIITVKGTMATYNNERQIAQGATATIDGHDDSYDNIDPITTIPEILKADDGLPLVVTGTVIKINEGWSSSYNNITVTIADDEGNQLYVYRLATNVALNDIITITGFVGSYYGSKQVAAGATAEIIGTHTCSKYTEATCTSGPKCVVCGSLNGDPIDHTYVDGKCACGAVQGIESVIESKEIAASAGTYDSTAKTITWTADGFTFVNAQASSTSAIRTSDGDHFRAYANSESTISGSNITKVVITCVSASYASACSNSVTTEGVTTVVDGNKVVITVNDGTLDSITIGATAQWRLNNIEVTYNK